MPRLTTEEEQAVIEPRPMKGFVETPYIKNLVKRALSYIKAGFPIHLRGASGTGKTTLALHLASKIARPSVLIHGDEEYSTSDLVGGEHGYRRKYLRDNFISSVLKEEENFTKQWMDNRLTIAVKHGFTLIYDEFTRSRPEANNTLLSILQEGLMDLPMTRQGEESYYLRVHPQFTAIFTSNPEEYAGTNKAQDALRDRMVTMDLRHFDKNTEVAITQAKSGLLQEDAKKIVNIVRALRDSGEYEFAPTVRGSIMLAKTLRTNNGKVSASDKMFCQLAQDILASETTRLGSSEHHKKVKKLVGKLITKHC
ncbi:gas vesicle protein GvpN [Candidatus Parcubacteria bacterium]|nr:gas vesicle protein GvpN [Patescibacteria group bacterium]MCG2688149.1 gas vesicle protein GvpN [Candidatus Parcubacteria bacterium]